MNFAPMVVNFLGFKINVMDHSATAVVGPSQQLDIFVSVKRNHGFGESNGDLSPIYIPITGVADPDVSDSNSVKGSIV
jgi:hypothetical protein